MGRFGGGGVKTRGVSEGAGDGGGSDGGEPPETRHEGGAGARKRAAGEIGRRRKKWLVKLDGP